MQDYSESSQTDPVVKDARRYQPVRDDAGWTVLDTQTAGRVYEQASGGARLDETGAMRLADLLNGLEDQSVQRDGQSDWPITPLR